MIQIYSYTENKSQISYSSNQVLGSFFVRLLTEKNIPMFSAHLSVTPNHHFFTSRNTSSRLLFSTINFSSKKTTKISFFPLT